MITVFAIFGKLNTTAKTDKERPLPYCIICRLLIGSDFDMRETYGYTCGHELETKIYV